DYGLPDYYVVDIPNGDYYGSVFYNEFITAFSNEYFSNGFDFAAAEAAAVPIALAAVGATTLNPTLDNTPEGAAYIAYAKSVFNTWKNRRQALNYGPQADYISPELPPAPAGDYSNWQSGSTAYYNSVLFDEGI